MRRLVLFLFVMAFVLGSSVGWAQTTGENLPQEAREKADKLIELLDNGQYQDSFELAASVVTDTPALWHGHMKSWRGSMGEAETRSLEQIESIPHFADLPKGEYLKLTYKTAFTSQPEATEIVVLNKGADGSWGVAGYEVQYNRWPEAVKMIVSGLFIVFFIMILLATITWGVGKMLQKTAKKAEAK